jgi:hypothetical protein
MALHTYNEYVDWGVRLKKYVRIFIRGRKDILHTEESEPYDVLTDTTIVRNVH